MRFFLKGMLKKLGMVLCISLVFVFAGCETVPCGYVVFEKTSGGWKMKEVIAPFLCNEGGITQDKVDRYIELLDETVPAHK